MLILLVHFIRLLLMHKDPNHQMTLNCNSQILSISLIQEIALFELSLTKCHDWLF